MKKIHIIGAGFSGLTTAYFLKKYLDDQCEVVVFESASQAGGILQSEWIEGHLLDHAANGILNHVLLQEIVRDLKLEYVPTSSESKKRYIYRASRGGARRLPLSFSEILRALGGFFFHWLRRTHRPQLGESVAGYARRVFGAGFCSYILEPALGGIYAGDVEKMSATMIFEKFFQKSVFVRPEQKGLVSFSESWRSWNSAMTSWLSQKGVQFQWGTLVSPKDIQEDPHSVWICATSLKSATTFLNGFSLGSSAQLSTENTPPSLLSLSKLTFEITDKAGGSTKTPQGFGCLFPKTEGFHSLGVLWNESIFPNRGSGKTETWILGGARHPHDVDKNVDELEALVRADRKRTGWDGELRRIHTVKWRDILPHYTFELEKKRNVFLNSKKPYFVGNYLGKIGLSGILERAQEVSREVSRHLK